MSKLEFKLPDIGEGVTEGEIVNWLVQDGDAVAENQEMVEVMTDKATVTIGAPKAGKVSERRFKVGDTVPVGEVLIVLDLSGGGAAPRRLVDLSQARSVTFGRACPA
jgi:pyruvate dehydrogenase E2 component (dihydrolipoamide acetyltransferase)